MNPLWISFRRQLHKSYLIDINSLLLREDKVLIVKGNARKQPKNNALTI